MRDLVWTPFIIIKVNWKEKKTEEEEKIAQRQEGFETTTSSFVGKLSNRWATTKSSLAKVIYA